MAPRKIKTATGKPKAVTKAKANAKSGPKKSASSPSPPAKTSMKRPAPSSSLSPLESIAEYDRNVRSKYARARNTFKLTRASLYDESINERSISEHWNKFPVDSPSKATWGLPDERPIEGTTRKKSGLGFRKSGKSMGGGGTMNIAEMFEQMRPQKTVPIPNDPNNSGLLRLCCEVRERIYGYLITYPKAIMVKHDLATVERNPYRDLAIILACKTIASEASNFLYRTNTFRVLLRKSISKSYSLYQPPTFTIDSKFLKYLQNITIDCSKESWNLDWFEKASKCVEKLVEANAVIESLTLVTIPQRVGMSSTALGMQANPITFADFMWYEGVFMAAIRKLAPKEFKIIVKKAGEEAPKRLEMIVNLKYLRSGNQELGPLVNPLTLKWASERAKLVEKELRGMKERFEEIFEDDKAAVERGKCRLVTPEVVVIEDREPSATTPSVADEESREGSEEGSAVRPRVVTEAHSAPFNKFNFF